MESTNIKKERHGAVTAWLVVMIIFNLVAAYMYFGQDLVQGSLNRGVSFYALIGLGILGIWNVICAVLLLRWIKWGFWGFVISAVCVFSINIYIGVVLIKCIAGLFGAPFLYGILTIRKNNISAWENLE